MVEILNPKFSKLRRVEGLPQKQVGRSRATVPSSGTSSQGQEGLLAQKYQRKQERRRLGVLDHWILKVIPWEEGRRGNLYRTMNWLSRSTRSVVHLIPSFGCYRFTQSRASLMNPRYQEFVEPLMQQLTANLGDTLAASISFCCGTSSSGRTDSWCAAKERAGLRHKSAQTFAEHVPRSSDSLAQIPQGSRGSQDKLLTH